MAITELVDVASFILAGLFLALGCFYSLDRTRTVDRLPGIIFILAAIREVFFIVPNYPNKFIRLKGYESFFVLFFQVIICAYCIASIYIKYQQQILIKTQKVYDHRSNNN